MVSTRYQASRELNVGEPTTGGKFHHRVQVQLTSLQVQAFNFQKHQEGKPAVKRAEKGGVRYLQSETIRLGGETGWCDMPLLKKHNACK